jgi:hypothetical protein
MDCSCGSATAELAAGVAGGLRLGFMVPLCCVSRVSASTL